MIRAIGRASRQGSGAGTTDMFRLGLDPAFISWQGTLNLLTAHAAELALTGVLWTLFTLGSQWLGGPQERWRVVDDDTNDGRR